MIKKAMLYYSRRDLWNLFLLCAFPLHIWTLLLSFNDVSWLSARTNMWDAIGVISYGMIFALLETLFLFLFAVFLGYFISPCWGSGKRVVLIGSLVLILSIWAMLTQLFSMLNWSVPVSWIDYLVASGHPARIFYPLLLAFVVSSVVIPVYAILRVEKIHLLINDLADRIYLLTTVYLGLDAMAFIIVTIRNIQGS